MNIDFPVDVFAPALVAAGLVLLLTNVLPRRNRVARTIVYVLLLALAIRYMHWRFWETLPAFEWRFGSLYAWGFFVLEFASHLSAFLAYRFLLNQGDRRSAADRLEQELRAAKTVPSVDVLIPTYNEDEGVLERTIACAMAIDYPRKSVYVLDDGRREWLKNLCERSGAHYVTRPDNSHAKAGNLNHALAYTAQRSAGELILVLDADFCAHRNILYRTVGFFSDPAVGIVQTPQAFFNPDPLQFNLRAVGAMPDEQRLLFDVLLPAKDQSNVATCCGTSSLTRRACLERIGGVPTESVTEDMLLSYRLYQLGYTTRYLNERLSVGLAPEGMSEYLTQRLRWCLGTLQQAFLHSGPVGRNATPWRNRLEYIATVLYWCASLPFLLCGIIAPIIFGLTGLSVVQTGLESYVWHFLPFFVAQMLAMRWLTGLPSLPIVNDAANLLVAITTTPLMLRALLQPFGRRFVVTNKGGDRTRRSIHTPLLWRVLLLALILAGAMALTLDPDQRLLYGGEGQRSLLINLFWGFHGLLILMAAALLTVELPRRRLQERFFCNEEASASANGKTSTCRIHDLSLSGARIQMEETLPLDSCVTLEIAGVGSLSGRVVRHAGASVCLRFDELKNQREALLVKLYGGSLRTNAMTPLEECQTMPIMDRVLRRVIGSSVS